MAYKVPVTFVFFNDCRLGKSVKSAMMLRDMLWINGHRPGDDSHELRAENRKRS